MFRMDFALIGKFLSTGSRRHPTGWVGHLIKPFSALIALGIVWVTTIQIVQIYAMTIVFIGLILALVFLVTGATESSSRERVPPWDLLLAAVSIGISAYFWYHTERIVTRITLLDELSTWDVICASGLMITIIEATRRTVGVGLTSIVLLFLAYNLWGDALPGVFGHGVITYRHFLDVLAFTTDGIFGVPIRVALTYVFLFGLFGTFLSRTGGGDFFFDLASSISGKAPGGPAKVAVVSSGLYGTISGSPTADVVATGSINIPMMKKLGYPAAMAGGIEVAASTGGSILPPVMGSAAFIMAEFTGIPYAEIAIAAIIPALLYYFCVYLQVHLNSLKLGITGLKEVPDFLSTMRRGGMFLAPLLALVTALLLGYSPVFVAVFGTFAVIAVAMLKRETRLGFKSLYEILAEATLRVVPVVAACAAAGLVVGGAVDDRAWRQGDRNHFRPGGRQLVRGTGGRRHSYVVAGHGHAYSERVYSGSRADRTRANPTRRLGDGRQPVSGLFRQPLRHDSADCGRRFCGGTDRAGQPDGHRVGRGENIHHGFRCSLRFRVRQWRSAGRERLADYPCLPHRDGSGGLPLSGGGRLLEAPDRTHQSLGACYRWSRTHDTIAGAAGWRRRDRCRRPDGPAAVAGTGGWWLSRRPCPADVGSHIVDSETASLQSQDGSRRPQSLLENPSDHRRKR
jgi:hypothetical protein